MVTSTLKKTLKRHLSYNVIYFPHIKFFVRFWRFSINVKNNQNTVFSWYFSVSAYSVLFTRFCVLILKKLKNDHNILFFGNIAFLHDFHCFGNWHTQKHLKCTFLVWRFVSNIECFACILAFWYLTMWKTLKIHVLCNVNLFFHILFYSSVLEFCYLRR